MALSFGKMPATSARRFDLAIETPDGERAHERHAPPSYTARRTPVKSGRMRPRHLSRRGAPLTGLLLTVRLPWRGPQRVRPISH